MREIKDSLHPILLTENAPIENTSQNEAINKKELNWITH